jgi:hypothetical protein
MKTWKRARADDSLARPVAATAATNAAKTIFAVVPIVIAPTS